MDYFVVHGRCELQDVDIFMSKFPDLPEYRIHVTQRNDIPGLLKELNIYPSTSKARHAGKVGKIDKGLYWIMASKKDRVFIIRRVDAEIDTGGNSHTTDGGYQVQRCQQAV